ncbi:MAG: UDP-glucose/GDP-mannose dehydrogenase family protein [Acidobacteria bacterium]|jgi:UDPglucose 6-dehydrogenase|nr:MAG: UDP-glucose/GDP-mannose dehydrogenase family protein [Acidobacteriota bacterium]GIU81112.1 MAG: UDP-glucose 6-dehydrogenase [Pyrinomonadaceae bacterium]
MVERISVIGLGKLGASMAACFAYRGFEVIGVDISPKVVDAVNSGKAPVQETGLDDLISANKERIRATLSHEEAVLNSDISFVIVPTPSDERGAFSLQYAAWAYKEIGKALAKKNGYHNVVLTSTVLPGSTRQVLMPVLEKESGKKAGKDFGVCYSPEFIALGSVIRDFLNPDFTLIGELDERCGEQLEQLYSKVVENGAPSARMSIENAELTKIAVNTFVTTKITFANMLAEICEKIPGGNVDVVTKALGMDSRIGHKYLKGALGYGGPCFPRDNIALSFIAKELGVSAELAKITDSMNRSIVGKVVEKVKKIANQGSTVAVLGLAYKPFSHVTEESQSIQIASALSKSGYRVVGYDPLAGEMALSDLHGQIVVLESAKRCLQQAEVVLITTPDPEFTKLKPEDFKNEFSKVTVIDFWRILKGILEDVPYVRYIPFGCSEDDQANTKRIREIWHFAKEEALKTVR